MKDELECRNISQRSFAKQVGMSYSVLNELLNAKRPLSPPMALLFEAALGISADMLMNIQTRYNMQTARKDSRIAQWLSNIPRVAALW